MDHTYNQKDGYLTDPLFVWNNIPWVDYDTNMLRTFLKQKFQWAWVELAKVRKAEDAISLSDGENSALISLNRGRTKAILTLRGKNKYEFIVRDGDSDEPIIYVDEFLIGNKYIPLSVKEMDLKIFQFYCQTRAFDLIHSIISIFIGRSSALVDILAKDERFVQALEKTKEHFNNMYKLFPLTQNQRND